MSNRAFWQDFVHTTWERTPAHLGRDLEPLLNPAELFSLAVGVAEALAGGDDRMRVRWCGDGRRTFNLAPEAASGELLPQRQDRNIEGYCQRMSARETFFFQLPRLQLFHPAIWPRVARLCRTLHSLIGTPGLMSWTDAYFGRYRSTPFGVHLDGASNFTFGVTGYKTFYLWEPDYYRQHMAARSVHDFAEFIPAAQKLTVGPGEVIYWPGRFYHVAVPDGQFSVTMNLAFYSEQPQSAWLLRAFQNTIADITALQGPLQGMELPRELSSSCATVVERVSSGALQRELLEAIVAHRTRFGFSDPPPLRPSTELAVGDRFFRAPEVELACVPDNLGEWIVGANGYSLRLPANHWVQGTIEQLNAGQRVVVQPDTQRLFDLLYRFGAVERFWS